MTNRLKEMGETASWRLLVAAAIEGATRSGYALKRQPGRGLSNTWEVTKDGEAKIASVRTTRDRYIAFPPLEGGKRWKTLDGADLVLVSAVDDPANPQNVDVYLFPADVVRQRFDASYAARIEHGHTVRDNFGMWIMLDVGDDQIASQVGSGLAVDYPAIARFSIDELEGAAVAPASVTEAAALEPEDTDGASPAFTTVAEVLASSRSEIARLTGMPLEAIKLDLKIEA
ncbi:MAG: hypothetical protein EOP17_03265 [Rhizobiaceae bacterium]|nr:MAG: hypothetical protein EOP17_03265 [Rhizobiaceae bacterium]